MSLTEVKVDRGEHAISKKRQVKRQQDQYLNE